jgi:hypothetical protein
MRTFAVPCDCAITVMAKHAESSRVAVLSEPQYERESSTIVTIALRVLTAIAVDVVDREELERRLTAACALTAIMFECFSTAAVAHARVLISNHLSIGLRKLRTSSAVARETTCSYFRVAVVLAHIRVLAITTRTATRAAWKATRRIDAVTLRTFNTHNVDYTMLSPRRIITV